MSKQRCGWVLESDPLYVAYHDEEWGVPIRDDRALWELLCLEGFQAGLSWITILRKRSAFREAFCGFEPDQVATFGPVDIERLMANPGIVRARAKIIATIDSARLFQSIQREEGGFSDFIWSVVGGTPIHNHPKSFREGPTKSAESEELARKLKAHGFKFCGPVICYAFMQAAGLVIDHETTCHAYRPA
jgi:DNA-3-methyladenine glycosylase I